MLISLDDFYRDINKDLKILGIFQNKRLVIDAKMLSSYYAKNYACITNSGLNSIDKNNDFCFE